MNNIKRLYAICSLLVGLVCWIRFGSLHFFTILMGGHMALLGVEYYREGNKEQLLFSMALALFLVWFGSGMLLHG